MSPQFPDGDTLEAALALAIRAPSARNCQPWRWRIGRDGLDLFADPGRLAAGTDPDRRDLVLSCGASLHHATVALAAMGWQARVHRLPDAADRNHLAALELTPRRADELDVTLAAAIANRRTDRRAYVSWPVPWNDIALMGARAARAGVMLRQIDLIPQLSDAVLRSVTDGRDDAAALVALGTETDDDLARLRAGEATSLVLLSATAMGLATCPVTEPLEIPGTRAAVRADVFGDSGHPQMMLRVGWAGTGAEPLPPTPRRPLTEVVDWSAAGSLAG